MATIPKPYTRQVQAFNPQRSAATGRPQALLEELAPAMRYKPQQAPVSQMLYSAPPSAEQVPMMDYLEGGPGIVGEGLEGTTDPAEMAENASILGIDSPIGFMMGKGNPFSTLLGMAVRGGKTVLPDVLEGLGLIGSPPVSVAEKGEIADAIVDLGGLPVAQESGKSGIPSIMGSMNEADIDAAFAPPSSLADIGIGGGFGAAGTVGNAGFGGLGGIASY